VNSNGICIRFQILGQLKETMEWKTPGENSPIFTPDLSGQNPTNASANVSASASRHCPGPADILEEV
jgi:hypothetical protein